MRKLYTIGILAVGLTAFTLIPKVVRKVSYEALEKHCLKDNDTLYVVNYWATWCKPCVAEMPFFVEAANKFAKQKVKVVFVSLNSLKEMETVERFVMKKKIEQDVLLLDAGNPNIWVDKVDPSWSGSIPATVIYKKKEKVFFREGEFTQTELDSVINLKLK
jgi:thiol-disulfide isomerase/thioredoxin